MIRGIHHVAIATHDLDRLVAFYTDVVGFEPAWTTSWADNPTIDRIVGFRGSAATSAMLRAGNCYLELFAYDDPPESHAPATDRAANNRGYTHLCLDVTDIDAEYQRMSDAGMSFHTPPPGFDELGGREVLRATYGRDPDGNIVEIQEIVNDVLHIGLEQTGMIG